MSTWVVSLGVPSGVVNEKLLDVQVGFITLATGLVLKPWRFPSRRSSVFTAVYRGSSLIVCLCRMVACLVKALGC